MSLRTGERKKRNKGERLGGGTDWKSIMVVRERRERE